MSMGDCENRVTNLTAKRYESVGNRCPMGTTLPDPISIFGTAYKYRKMWVAIPSTFDGDLQRKPTPGQYPYYAEVYFDQSTVNTARITVEIEGAPQGSNTRIDVLEKLYSFGTYGNGKIILSGKDFMCVAVNDVPIRNPDRGPVRKKATKR